MVGRGDFVEIVRITAAAKALLPVEQSSVERTSLLFVTNPEVEKSLVPVVVIHQRAKQVVKCANALTLIGYPNILCVRNTGSFIDHRTCEQVVRAINREQLD